MNWPEQGRAEAGRWLVGGRQSWSKVRRRLPEQGASGLLRLSANVYTRRWLVLGMEIGWIWRVLDWRCCFGWVGLDWTGLGWVG